MMSTYGVCSPPYETVCRQIDPATVVCQCAMQRGVIDLVLNIVVIGVVITVIVIGTIVIYARLMEWKNSR